jgi:hypothetical protein
MNFKFVFSPSAICQLDFSIINISIFWNLTLYFFSKTVAPYDRDEVKIIMATEIALASWSRFACF